MKAVKKLFALLLCLSMLLQIGIPAYAATSETNLYAEASATEAKAGDTITLTISNKDMVASGIKAGFYFDKTRLEVDKITWAIITAYDEDADEDKMNLPTSSTSKKKANTDGSALGVYAINSGVDSECYEGTIVTVKFVVKDDAPAGEATITLREETVGTNAFKSDNINPITITIKEAEATCDHEGKTYTYKSNGDGTHKVTCECGETVDAEAKCSGGNATCKAKAKCSLCKAEYGSLGDHDYAKVAAKDAVHTKDELKAGVDAHYKCSVCEKLFTADTKTETTLEALTGKKPEHTWNDGEVSTAPGCESKGEKTYTCTYEGCGATKTEPIEVKGHTYGELIPATDAVHTKDELKGAVAAHYQCSVCKKYFDADKKETTLEALTSDAPEHTVEESKTTIVEITKEPTCTEEGTKVVETFCSCGKSLGTKEEPILVDSNAHSWGTPDYTWSDDNTSCTAVRACGHNGKHTETAISKEVTTEKINDATCGAAGQTKYTAIFDKTWASTSKTVDLPGATGEHTYALDTTKGTNGYTWAEDNSTCTAYGKCACGAETTATAQITSEVTTQADCQTAKVVTYTAAFTETWATEQTKQVTGTKDPSEHTGKNLTYSNITDSTHDVICECGETIHTAQSHDYKHDEANHKCVCGKVEVFTLTFTDSWERDYGTITAPYGSDITAQLAERKECYNNHSANTGKTTLSRWRDADRNEVTLTTMPAQNMTLYAVGKFVSYTVTWMVDGKVYHTCTVIYANQLYTKMEDPTKANYTFQHWVDEDNNVLSFKRSESFPANIYSNFSYSKTDDSVYTAVFTPNVYTVKCGDVELTANEDNNWTVEIPADPTQTGYEFIGWATTEDATEADTEYKAGDKVAFSADATLYPVFKISTYTITADGVVYPFAYDATVTIPDPTKEGHTFMGWEKDSADYTIPATMPAENITLTSKWQVNEYNLYVYDLNGQYLLTQKVSYGASVYDIVKDLKADKRVVETDTQIGHNVFAGWLDMNGNPIVSDYTMPASELRIIAAMAFTGWIKYGYIDGWVYEVEDEIQKTGWTEIDDAWYYLDPSTGIRAEGKTRVPYPTEAINGKTYGPDQEAMEYAASKGNTFIDATEAWFVFDTNGKFQSNYTGMSGYMKPYYENGMQVWHPGVVENGASGMYYYYIGHKTSGGNVLPNDGDIYVQKVTQNNSNTIQFVKNGVYTVKLGVIQNYNGITEMEDGTLRYYENARLMTRNGLTKVEDNYIYVRTSGELAVSRMYWVPENDLGIVSGAYQFDAQGFMVEPKTTDKNGIVEEDGGLYYYENGKRCYAGLIEIDGDMYYVRSNGQVAVGEYYVTKVNNTGIAAGTKLTFGADGKMVPVKNGIVEEDGKHYYYENNKLVCGAGVVKLTDENGEIFYIYVRSNGQLATGIYWPTTRNDLLPRGAYDWGTDGKYYPG